MAECLHCEINELVHQRIEQGDADLAELTSMMAESLVDLILMAPETIRASLMADTLAQFGQLYLDKSGAGDSEGSGATH